MTYTVRFSERAGDDLAEVEAYLLPIAGHQVTRRYVQRLIDYCQSLGLFPHRGVAWDIRPGIRLLGYRKRATIAFFVEGDSVVIVRIFHHGREHFLENPGETPST